MSKKEESGLIQENFWDELENDKIIKWNPSGQYDKTFEPKYKQFLNYFHNLPDLPSINVGDIIVGKISKISKKEIIVDINYKDSIYVEVKSADSKIVENLKKGEDINVMITTIKDNPYEIKGSITELIKMDVANKLKKFYQDNISLKAMVKELIPAGFMLDIEMNNINLTAFMPNTLAGVNRLTPEQSQSILGTEINVMLETLQQEKGVYVVSRKKYLESLIPEYIEIVKKIRNTIPDYVYQGTVTGTKDFGIFVEFGIDSTTEICLTGMIHKVNINPSHQDKIHTIKPGTVITFYCRDILKGNKIILTQMLRESLWDTIRVGQIKEGTILTVKPFGALVALDEETTGLIQNTYIERSKRKLEKGDKVEVKIVSVIKDDRKIYLDFPKND
jgi:small subunit ribosomal protein S1